MVRNFLLFLLFSAFSCAHAAGKSEALVFSANCKNAYRQFVSLRFREGEKWLEAERKANPNNAMVAFLENFPDVIRCFVTEENKVFESVKNNKEDRLSRLEYADSKSPYHNLALAETHLMWAMGRIKYEEYVTAALELNRAYRLLVENQKKFPGFALNKKSLGLLHFMIGTIPDSYKYITNILGIRGTVKQGLSELKSFYALTQSDPEYAIYRTEAMLYLGMVLINYTPYEADALEIMKDIEKETSVNPLMLYIYGSIGLKSGHSDEVVSLFLKNPFGSDYFPFPYLYLQLGEAKLNRQDDDALVWLNKYLTSFKGKNYIKAANQRISWYYLLKGDDAKARFYFKEINGIGEIIVDEDKQALKNYHDNLMPHPGLLKARLLYDGGYYKRAFAVLASLDPKTFGSMQFQIEYLYRMGKVLHKTGNEKQAITDLEKTFVLGEKQPYYYASAAAIQLGMIYEVKGDKQLALSYYRKALQTAKHDFRNSLDQKAKAGINRIEGD